jgi:arylsulfate sulfotransferase
MSVDLMDSAPPVPLVGAPVIWTAIASGHGAKPVYQFSIGLAGGPSAVVRDFGPTSSFTWNPMQEGNYDIQVTVKNNYTAKSGESAVATYTAQTRTVGSDAVISPMSNPLVALYSAPPSSGTSMYVQFVPQASPSTWANTTPLQIVPGESTNFIVAGMLPSTTYLMRHVLDDGTVSATQTFTTGSLPTYLTFPTFTVVQGPDANTDLSQNLVFHQATVNHTTTASDVTTMATYLNGNILWYYDPVSNNFRGYAQNLEPGGTVMMMGGSAIGIGGGFDTLRVVDLAGDILHETNVYAVRAQLTAMGYAPEYDFNHEVKLLPNGDIAVMAHTQKTVTYKGKPTKFMGDEVIILDQNLRVTWVWNAFDWLNTNRLGTVGEGANDWLHGNAISWSPQDQNLILSLRSQDWVVKINYANGAGDGHVVWKLGQGGNFKYKAKGPNPWFSHQHDARYINNNTIILFDDGNTRYKTDKTAHSRGQEWVIDESTLTATLVVNADMGNYSPFLGSAQVLSNGNLAFCSGGQGSGTNLFAQSIEVLPDGTVSYVLQMSGYEYRSYFESSLYSADFIN